MTPPRWLLAVLLLLSAGLAFVLWGRMWHPIGRGSIAFNDFFAHWSYARFAVSHPGPAIYDPATIHAFQEALAARPLLKNPFAYPPAYLLLVAPLALLNIWAAFVLWSVASVAAFTVAVCAGRWRGWLALLAVTAPATLVCLAYGQTGLLVAALLAGGLRLLPSRPGWAGGLLALACIKPTLAMLVPIALLAGRQWQAIGAALATGALLIAASTLWLGPTIWPAWLHAALAHGDYVIDVVPFHRHATPLATLRQLGLAQPISAVLQSGVAALVALGVAAAWWRVPTGGSEGVSRGLSGEDAGHVLLAGALLATPYAIHYDLTLPTAAALGIAATSAPLSWRGPSWRPSSLIPAAILLAALLLPALLTLTSRFFWTGPVVLAALFLLCLVRCWRPGKISLATKGTLS